MDKTIGFIGCGNMGKAMVEGIMKAELVEGEQLIVSNAHPEKLQELSRMYDFYISDNETVAAHADVLILAIKPYLYAKIITEIKDLLKPDVILIDIAAGISIADMHEMMGRECKIAKVMPNTPALVLEAMSAVSFSKQMDQADRDAVWQILTCFGQACEVEEHLMDAVTALSGSSPAYVFMFIEAMGDGAVMLGMDRAKAYRFAAQSVLGAAKLLLETGMHPGECKDMVCSPGGTTIEALAKLEEKGMRSALIEAMKVCAERSKEMSRK